MNRRHYIFSMTSKLISCLSVLTKEEWTSFRKFLLMKTGEESDNYLLFKALQKRKSKLAEMKNADKIWRDEFSHMSQKVFANLQSRIMNWLKEWIVFYDAQKNKYKQNVELIEGYNKRGLYQLADQVYTKTLKQLGDDESAEHDYIIASLHKAQYFSDNPIKHTIGATLLEDVVHSYFQWHSKQTSLYLAELYNWGDIQHVEFANEKEICDQIILQEKLSPAYQLVLKLVAQKDPRYLLELIKELESNKFEDGTITLIMLFNYCLVYYMRLYIEGNIDNPKLLLRLYETGMNNGSFFSNGKIPTRRFHNIVNAISICVPKEACDQFIQKWADRVSTTDLESSKKIALAISCLCYEKYSEMIELLRETHYEDITMKIKAGSLLSIALYEEGHKYYDSLHNHLFNFRRQLKRNQSKLSNKFYHASLNLIDFIEKLASQNKSIIKNIELVDYPYFMYRSWAKRKLQTYQTSYKRAEQMSNPF